MYVDPWLLFVIFCAGATLGRWLGDQSTGPTEPNRE